MLKTTPIPEILKELIAGRPIVLLDDSDRENEGDLVCLADSISSESIAFMMEHGKGLICLSIEEQRRKALGIPLQVEINESTFGTNFGCPFGYKGVGGDGITARARAETILKACEPEVLKEDFVVPGFVVPVIARSGGVLKRRGQTEGSVDLAKLAGAFPAGVICEIMDDHGLMIRGDDLQGYIEQHTLRACTIEELVQYRKSFETSIRLVAEEQVPLSSFTRTKILNLLNENVSDTLRNLATQNLTCDADKPDDTTAFIKIYQDDIDQMEHFSIQIGELKEGALVRVHSECLTGDVLGSLRCDCGPQLDAALNLMLDKREGLLIYLQQEGRGIGLANKLRAYEIQDSQGLDTVDANIKLGFPVDARDYRVAAQILKENKLTKISLVTNNPLKLESLATFGITIERRIPLEIPPQKENLSYLNTKKTKLGHFLEN